MPAVKQRLAAYAELVEDALTGYLPLCPEPESVVADAMGYSLLGGGKRIRGSLVLAFYNLFCGDVRPALPYAGALEMIHACSLIHDDMPCMDDDDLRRGKPSCHIAYGEATALLAGDALLALAFEIIADKRHSGAFPDGRALECVRCLASATGCTGMIGGQAIDLAQEGKETPSKLLERMYAKKTGALFTAAARIGCVLGGADSDTIQAAVAYMNNLGLAFQIVDDMLDVAGDEALLGKPVGSDDGNGKTTYVRVYGLEAARESVARLNEAAKAALAGIRADTAFLAGLADLLAGRKY